jgi:hypothetical protein
MNGQFALDAILTKAFHENSWTWRSSKSRKTGAMWRLYRVTSQAIRNSSNHIGRIRSVTGWCAVAQDSSENDIVLPDYTDEAIDELHEDAKNLIENSEAWRKVVSRIADKTSSLKDDLFSKGHSTRDINIAQGHYYGMTIYESFFDAIKNEIERREAQEKKKNQNFHSTKMAPPENQEFLLRN